MSDVLKQTYSGYIRETYITCETKVYQVSQDTAANTSLCRVVVTLKCTNGASYHLTNDGAVTIKAAGTTILSATGLSGFDFRDYTSKEIYNQTATITHDTDGTYSETFSTKCTYGTYADGTSTGTVAFDGIPRASAIGTISAFNLEDSFSVPLTKYSETFTDTLVIKQGETTIKTITEYTSETAINLTEDELLAAYGTVSDLIETFTFETTTLSGATTIGTDSATATGTVAGTSYLNVSGTWKRAIPYINVSGVWKKAVCSLNVSGTWKRGIG